MSSDGANSFIENLSQLADAEGQARFTEDCFQAECAVAGDEAFLEFLGMMVPSLARMFVRLALQTRSDYKEQTFNEALRTMPIVIGGTLTTLGDDAKKRLLYNMMRSYNHVDTVLRDIVAHDFNPKDVPHAKLSQTFAAATIRGILSLFSGVPDNNPLTAEEKQAVDVLCATRVQGNDVPRCTFCRSAVTQARMIGEFPFCGDACHDAAVMIYIAERARGLRPLIQTEQPEEQAPNEVDPTTD